MPVRIVTVPFDPEQGCFQDEDLNRFLLNKKVRGLRAEFFLAEGRPYWSVFVQYDPVLPDGPGGVDGLDEPQRLLLARLRQWRKEKAEREGVPVYIIATNTQILEVVRRRPETLEALRQIKGFGKKKMERHGKEIVALVQDFYEKRPPQGRGGGRDRVPACEEPAAGGPRGHAPEEAQ